MKDWYFYQDKGRTQGPLTLEDLKVRVREGRLRLFDLIYKEGEPGWRMALEHPDLRGEFKQSGGHTAERPWVCLHRKNDETFDFVTLGPFTEDEVRQAIAAGHLSYGDYAWKQDFKEWARLGSLEEFNPRAATLNRAAKAKPAREETSERLLRDVVEMKRRAPTEKAEPRPIEARGPDLTKDEDDIATRIVSRQDLAAMSAPPPPPEAGKVKPKVFQDMSFKPPPADPEATRIVTRDPDATRIAPRPRLDDDATRIVARDNERTRIVTRDDDATKVVPHISTRGPLLEDEDEIERRPLIDEPLEEEPIAPARNWRLGKKRFSTDWAIVIGLVGVLMVVIVVLSRRSAHVDEIPPTLPVLEHLEANGTAELRPPPEDGSAGPDVLPPPEVAPPKATVAEPPAPQHSVPPPAPPAPAAPKPRAPTTLSLKASASGEDYKIEVRSDGTAEFPVFLQIIGAPGQVAEGAAYYRYVKVVPKGTAQEPLVVPDLKLPPGRYKLRAETASLQREADFNFGTGETSYKQAVARARKLNAAAIWGERLGLFRQARALEQQLAAGQLRGFEALGQVKKSTGANYIFFEDWWEMKEIVREARQQKITPALKERARRLRERVATFSVWRLR